MNKKSEKQCPYCGHIYPLDFLICPNCGKKYKKNFNVLSMNNQTK